MQLFFVILALSILSGCSTKKATKHRVTLKSHEKPHEQKFAPYQLRNQNSITLSLYDEYLKWYGTPYRFGGSTFSGVDCSSLVQNIYWSAFRVTLPRTVKQQVKHGYFIKKSALQEGDLIFFKTGYNSRHSGIYLEKGNFINASSKNGVTISNLNNPYWKSKYWQSRRVLPR